MKELVVRTPTDSRKEVYKGFQFTVICFAQKKKRNHMKELVVRTPTDSRKEVYKGFQFTLICFMFSNSYG